MGWDMYDYEGRRIYLASGMDRCMAFLLYIIGMDGAVGVGSDRIEWVAL